MTQTLEQLSAAATDGELLPCPFCGGKAFLRAPKLPMMADCDDVQVSCEDCDVNGPSILFDQDVHGETDLPELEAEAITAWNTRAGQLVAVADDAIERYRHVKRGTVYEIVGEAELQTNADNLVDGSQMMVYRGEDGRLWCRHYDEFHDGRFAALAAKGTGDE